MLCTNLKCQEDIGPRVKPEWMIAEGVSQETGKWATFACPRCGEHIRMFEWKRKSHGISNNPIAR